MTTGNAPTLEDKLICHAPGDRCYGCDHYHGRSDVCKYAPELQSIRSAELPVEPKVYGVSYRDFDIIELKRGDRKELYVSLSDYDSLQSALKLAQERIKYYEAITTGAEHSAIDKAMSAELLKEVEK